MVMTDEDPLEMEEGLNQAKAAILGDAPMMEQPPDGSVTLFRGLFHGSSWHTDAEVSELTGEDEEVIARAIPTSPTSAMSTSCKALRLAGAST